MKEKKNTPLVWQIGVCISFKENFCVCLRLPKIVINIINAHLLNFYAKGSSLRILGKYLIKVAYT